MLDYYSVYESKSSYPRWTMPTQPQNIKFYRLGVLFFLLKKTGKCPGMVAMVLGGRVCGFFLFVLNKDMAWHFSSVKR